MVQDTIPLLDHLSDRPLRDPNLSEQLSLLERMNVKLSAQNSVPSPLSTEKKGCQSQKHSLKSPHSLTRTPFSLTPRKRKLSASILTNSIPSTTMPRTNCLQSPYPKRRKQSTTQYTRSSIRSPTELSAGENEMVIPQEKNQTISTRSLVKNPKSKSPT